MALAVPKGRAMDNEIIDISQAIVPIPVREPGDDADQIELDDAAGAAMFKDYNWTEPEARQLSTEPPEARRLRSVPPMPTGMKDALAEADARIRESRLPIKIRPEEYEVTAEAVAALAAHPNIYQRAGMLVQVVRDPAPASSFVRPPGAPRIVMLGTAATRERMTETANWLTWSTPAKQWLPVHPPDWAVAQVHGRGHWPGILPLEAVIETPILRPDGTILDTAGYDASTGILYEPTGTFPSVSDSPSRDDARNAAAALLGIVEDFPFETPAHRAAWLAAILTPFARFAFRGPSPLFLIDANTRGAGKSLLADIIGTIALGRPMARMSKPEKEEEWPKKITSIALCGDPMILIDNVNGMLGGATLDTVLTGTEWTDRVLGTNQMVRLPLLATWYATGNNVALGGDTLRRTLHIRLQTAMEHPETRAGFQHPRILAWIATERPRLVFAALMVLRAFCVAGRPGGLRPWGSFDGWSDMVRGAVVFAGLPDPVLATEALREQSDAEMGALKDLLMGLREMNPGTAGLTVREIIGRLENSSQSFARMRNALDELAPQKGGKYDARAVGRALRRYRERVVDVEGFRLALRQTRLNRDGVAQWGVFETTPAETTPETTPAETTPAEATSSPEHH